MSRFDLNNPIDFAKATVGSTAGILQNFLGKDPADWDIVEGSYKANDPSPAARTSKPVLFHIFKSQSQYQAALGKLTDQGGRRKVKYVFPYTDGQTTDDTGRKPITITVDGLIFGNNYKVGLQQLLNEILKPFPGTLLHPVMGTFTVALEDYELIHGPENNKAVIIRMVFTEHNFSIGQFGTQKLGSATTTSALSKALAFFGSVQATLTKVSGAIGFATSLKAQITGAIQAFSAQLGAVLGNINLSFNGANASDIPTLLPVSIGGNLNQSTGQKVGTTFQTVASPSDPFQQASLLAQANTVVALTPTQILQQVNGARDQANAVIALMASGNGGLGELQFYDDIITIKTAMNDLQDALEIAIANSKATIVNFVTPRIMSLREVAFANNLNPDRVTDILTLNSAIILSSNYIDAGVTLQVPTQ